MDSGYLHDMFHCGRGYMNFCSDRRRESHKSMHYQMHWWGGTSGRWLQPTYRKPAAITFLASGLLEARGRLNSMMQSKSSSSNHKDIRMDTEIDSKTRKGARWPEISFALSLHHSSLHKLKGAVGKASLQILQQSSGFFTELPFLVPHLTSGV
jgi:hypothetical protein